MPLLCVMFDLDGTLVDSETLCNQAFIDLLPEMTDGVDTLIRRYRGRKLASILADLEKRVGKRLPETFESHYRRRVAELFDLELKPTPGTREMLDSIHYPMCIASSGPEVKIKHALRVSGLAQYFGNRLYSSYTVGVWKPHPGLFLYAANAMGFNPSDCAVVEDSQVGIEAARAAGMHAIHYLPHTNETDSISCNRTIKHMSELPRLLDGLASGV